MARIPETGSELVRHPRVRSLLELCLETDALGDPAEAARKLSLPVHQASPAPSSDKKPGQLQTDQQLLTRSLLSPKKHDSEEAAEDFELDDDEMLSSRSHPPHGPTLWASRSAERNSQGSPMAGLKQKAELKIEFGSRWL